MGGVDDVIVVVVDVVVVVVQVVESTELRFRQVEGTFDGIRPCPAAAAAGDFVRRNASAGALWTLSEVLVWFLRRRSRWMTTGIDE